MILFKKYKERRMYPINPNSHLLANGIMRKNAILKPSNSNAHIDSGVILNRDSRVDFDGYTDLATSHWLFGSRAAANSRCFAFQQASSTSTTYYYSSNGAQAVGSPINIRRLYSMRKNTVYINGSLINTWNYPAVTFTTPNTATIFGINQNGVVNPSSGANVYCYGIKIWDASGNLIRDFIPALRVTDNEPGLYDAVNNLFYTKLGTGTLQAI